MPYMAHPLPVMKWAVIESTRSGLIDMIGWGINCFIMPLFFLMSGFLTSLASERSSARQLVMSRGKRLGAAFAIGCVLILPLDLYAWLLGLVVQGEIPFAKLRSLKIEGQLRHDLAGFSHLWYLQCLAALTLAATLANRFRPTCHSRISLSWTILGAAVASIAALRWEPEILLGFKNQWFPSPAKLLFYSGPFVIGWRFAQQPDVARHGKWPLPLCLAAVLLFACLFPEIALHIKSAEGGSRLTLLAIAFAVAGTATALGVFAMALQIQKPPTAAIRYVAGASLWIYLLHHPVVAITQVDLLNTALPTEIKVLVTFSAGVALPLMTYGAIVERTILGRLLNGGAVKSSSAPAVLSPQRSAA